MVRLACQLTLHIEETTSGYQVAVSTDGSDEGFQFTLRDLPEPPEDLQWYLEEYPRSPFDAETSRAERLTTTLLEFGKRLHQAVSPTPTVDAIWQRFLTRESTSRCVVLVTEAPKVVRIPWELLATDAGFLFQQGISVVRALPGLLPDCRVRLPDVVPTLLLVVPRPEHPATPFLSPRTTHRILLDVLEECATLKLEYLVTPTWSAFRQRLHDIERPIHFIHFDGHGLLRKTGPVLCFEEDDNGLREVDAHEFAEVLRSQRPLWVVLEACQSAWTDPSETAASFTHTLLSAGVQAVIASPFRVRATSTARFFAAFYRSLGAGISFRDAVTAGRQALFADSAEITVGSLAGQAQLCLQEWFTPLLYQCGSDFTLQTTNPAGAFSSPPGDIPIAARTIRELELHHLLRMLWAYETIFLFGLKGIGKTSLALEAGSWGLRTGAFSEIHYVDLNSPEAYSEAGTQLRSYSRRRRMNRPPLWIFDNTHLLGRSGANHLLRDAIWAQRYGGCALLFVTDDARWAQEAPQQHSVGQALRLDGLTPADATAYVASVAIGAGRSIPDRQTLSDLLDPLNGHPAMIKSALNELFVEARTESDVPDPEGSDVASIVERAARQLRPGQRALLESLALWDCRLTALTGSQVLGLAPHEWRIFERTVLDELAGVGLLIKTSITLPAWFAAEFLGNVAVPRGDGVLTASLTVACYQLHPALARLNRQRWDRETLSHLEDRYLPVYEALAAQLCRYWRDDPPTVELILRWEVSNLHRALRQLIAAGESERSADLALSLAQCLDVTGKREQARNVLNLVGQALTGQFESQRNAPPATVVELVAGWCQSLLVDGNVAEASKLAEKLLEWATSATYEEDRRLLLSVLTTAAQRHKAACDFEDAEMLLLKALALSKEPGNSTSQLRHAVGLIHLELGVIYAAVQRHSEASEQYRLALAQFRSLPDQAVVHGALGGLAREDSDLTGAANSLQVIRDYVRANGDTDALISVTHELGRVYQERAPLNETGHGREDNLRRAEALFKEALSLALRHENFDAAAAASTQLGFIAGLQLRREDAEAWFRSALTLQARTTDEIMIALSRYNLGFCIFRQRCSTTCARGDGWLVEAAELVFPAVEILGRCGYPDLARCREVAAEIARAIREATESGCLRQIHQPARRRRHLIVRHRPVQ